jgi:hypothetical protein
MTYPRNEEFALRYDYDFSKDGGAVSAITLNPNINAIEEGFILRRVRIVVKTGLTSGGAATLTLGNTTDPDGYMADFFSLVGSDNLVVNSEAVGGALIWDDTNDHMIEYAIDSTAANQDLLLTVGTAALTAGVMEIYLYGAYGAKADS